MSLPRRVIGALSSALLLGCVLACGPYLDAQQVAKDRTNLTRLAKAYLDFEADTGKGPADAAEWDRWAQKGGDVDLVALIAECKPGQKFVFSWGVKTGALPGAKEGVVLGYASRLPASGRRLVAMADGSVRDMTKEEFEGAARPAKEVGDKDEK